ncbi:MAG: tetratricopeptide repeat protein [Clostridiales bacterium]|jgi:tetratricopeptide (TPR) repeat protein|nr:tetratricopeptide repeat protein [Clostridiales bacterium]
MRCISCGAEIKSPNCKKCGADNSLAVRVYKTADALYNRGLALAKQSRLTEAEASLRRSLAAYKGNAEARNLLGALCFVTGRPGDAREQWTVVQRQNPEDKLSAGYLERMGKNPAQIERMTDAVGMYNNALKYLEQQSEDIAVIQLKKACDISPGFLRALNLLTACYIAAGDTRKAAVVCERALALDPGSGEALRYFAMLGAGRPAKGTAPPPKRTASASGGLFRYAGYAAAFAVGLAAAALATGLFFMSPAVTKLEGEVARISGESEQERARLNGIIDDLNTKASGLGASVQSLLAERDAALKDADIQKRVTEVYQAAETLDDDPMKAADALNAMTFDDLPEDVQSRRAELLAQAMARLERAYFNEGTALYNGGAARYGEAKEKLSASAQYTSDRSETIGSCYYYLGRIAEAQTDVNSARTYYQLAMDSPAGTITSGNRQNAQYRLGRL